MTAKVTATITQPIPLLSAHGAIRQGGRCLRGRTTSATVSLPVAQPTATDDEPYHHSEYERSDDRRGPWLPGLTMGGHWQLPVAEPSSVALICKRPVEANTQGHG